MRVTLFSQGNEHRFGQKDHGSAEAPGDRFERLSTVIARQIRIWRESKSSVASLIRIKTRDVQHAAHNLNDMISVIKTAEHGLEEVLVLLQMMDEVAIKASDALVKPEQSTSLQLKMETLSMELSAVVSQTSFGGQCLFDGSFSRRTFQTGADQGHLITVELSDLLPNGPVISNLSDGSSIGETRELVRQVLIQAHLMRQHLQTTGDQLALRVQWLGAEICNLESVQATFEDEEIIRDAARFSRLAVLQSSELALLAQGNLSRSNAERLVRPKTRKRRRLC